MEPVKGGTLADPPAAVKDILTAANPAMSPAVWAIRFAASLDGIITVLSGMSNTAQMEDNLNAMRAFKPLDDQERAVIERAQAALNAIPSIACTGCRYCVDGCPMSIPIPDIFSAMNKHLIFGQTEGAKRDYKWETRNGGKASDCVQCGQCEAACPQHLPIIETLKQCAATLE
jgi:predicted aldo/keto reductase-like oxidoreductase